MRSNLSRSFSTKSNIRRRIRTYRRGKTTGEWAARFAEEFHRARIQPHFLVNIILLIRRDVKKKMRGCCGAVDICSGVAGCLYLGAAGRWSLLCLGLAPFDTSLSLVCCAADS